MYILIVSRGYPNSRYKKNGLFEFDQAKALTKIGHKVIFAVIDLRSIKKRRKWGFESFIKDGVRVEVINLPIGKKFSKFLGVYAFDILYKKVIKKYGKPDIIHSHFIWIGYIVQKYFKNKRDSIPLVLTEHYSGMNLEKLDFNLKKMGEETYYSVDKVITVSSHLAKNLKKHFGIDSVVIPNIVDTTNFKFQPRCEFNSDFNFICTGSLLKNKRIDILIDAFYYAFKNNKQVKLYIYGQGPEKVNLEKKISEYQIENQVFLMGQVDRSEIAKKMAGSDCFVLVSKRETFGVSLIEAMAVGLPVISTKSGGPEDFVNEENGLLVSVDNKEQLISALQFMYKNINTFNRKKISEQTLKRFSPETVAKQLTNFYESILND